MSHKDSIAVQRPDDGNDSALLENPTGIDDLPTEVMFAIFKYLPLESLLVCERVSQKWRKYARDSSLWRRILIIYSGKSCHRCTAKKTLELIRSHSELIFSLKLQYINRYENVKALLDRCNNLSWLELTMCDIGKQFEGDVKRWPNLVRLSLKNSLMSRTKGNEDIHEIDDNDGNANDESENADKDGLFIQYDQFQKLVSLSLPDFGLNSKTCYSLLNCKHLNSIFIEKVRNLSKEFMTQLIQTRKSILLTLHIYGGDDVDDNTLELLADCPKLRDLAIIRCENLTDKGLLAFTRMAQLQHLQIWNNNQFSEMILMRVLGTYPLIQLHTLSLSRIENIGPLVVNVIADCYKNLKFLAFYQCPKIVNTDYVKQLKYKFRNIDVVLY